MGIFEFLSEAFKSKKTVADKPEILFDTLEVECPLVRRLHHSGLLKHSEVPVESKSFAFVVGCSNKTWQSLSVEQKQDFISDAMKDLRNKRGIIFVNHAGVKVGSEIIDGGIVEHYAATDITKVLVDDRLIPFADYIQSHATFLESVESD